MIEFKGTYSPDIQAWYFLFRDEWFIDKTISENFPYVVDVSNNGNLVGIEVLSKEVDMDELERLRAKYERT